MKTISELSNQELKIKLESLVRDERNLLCEILNHLREVERRKLHLAWGYPSLYEYVRSLGYSESAAYRRISAMRLLKEMPELQESVNTGTLNLSQLASAADYFKKEKKLGNTVTHEEKKELILDLQGKSTRECEKMIAAKNPEIANRSESEKMLTSELTEVRLVMSEALMTKVKKLKNLKSHVNPNPTYAEMFEMCVDEVLKKYEAKKFEDNGKTQEIPPPAPEVKEPTWVTSKRSRAIPIQTKRFIFGRDQGRCTYRDPESGRVCGSRFQLEIDHRMPYSMGGDHSTRNLRLLCRAHNQYRMKLKAVHDG